MGGVAAICTFWAGVREPVRSKARTGRPNHAGWNMPSRAVRLPPPKNFIRER
jgi:hypothetical protein